MKFNVPPQWPQPPEGWIPDPGWQPEAAWPRPPAGWHFWVNDYGVPIEGPPGLFGGSVRRLRWTRVALAAGAAFVLLVLGVSVGSAGGASGGPAPLAALPTHTASVTVTATPSPAPTVTVTSPPETVTAPPETVTPAPETVTATVEVTVESSQSGEGLGIAGSPASGGSAGSTSVYYANCTDARAAGDTPLYRGEPGYRSGLDRDDDGIACE